MLEPKSPRYDSTVSTVTVTTACGTQVGCTSRQTGCTLIRCSALSSCIFFCNSVWVWVDGPSELLSYCTGHWLQKKVLLSTSRSKQSFLIKKIWNAWSHHCPNKTTATQWVGRRQTVVLAVENATDQFRFAWCVHVSWCICPCTARLEGSQCTKRCSRPLLALAQFGQIKKAKGPKESERAGSAEIAPERWSPQLRVGGKSRKGQSAKASPTTDTGAGASHRIQLKWISKLRQRWKHHRDSPVPGAYNVLPVQVSGPMSGLRCKTL